MAFGAQQNMSRNIPLEKLLEPGKMRDDLQKGSRNKDLSKTKLCIYFAQGMCTLGESCQFAHSASEMRAAPNLAKTQLCTKFMNGYCPNQNCTYAHGEAELVNPPNFKKKMCHWHAKGKCRNGAKCGFAHQLSELVPGSGSETFEKQSNDSKLPPPGLEIDWDASTIAPSSLSQYESDISAISNVSRGSMPDENLYRMMAGRGSAPLKEQIASMGSAIADLQAKLSQMENKVSTNQLGQMQQRLQQLTQQYGTMQAEQRPSLSLVAERKPSMNPSAAPFYPAKPAAQDGSTAAVKSDANKRSNSVVKKARPKASVPAAKPSDNHRQAAKSSKVSWQAFGGRAMLGLATILLMVMVELHMSK